jgi:hypothetical protein
MKKIFYQKPYLLSLIFSMALLLISLQCRTRSPFLEETAHLDFSHPVFSETLSEVVTNDMSLEQKLERLFYFTRDTIEFIPDASLSASEALEKRKAICYTKAMVYVAFCRRLRVPAQLALIKFLAKGDPDSRPVYHGIAKILFNEKWLYIDTVSNRQSWSLWKFRDADTFEAPRFSLEKNVIVNSRYISDVSFEDFETNDVPEPWLESLQKHKETGKW